MRNPDKKLFPKFDCDVSHILTLSIFRTVSIPVEYNKMQGTIVIIKIMGIPTSLHIDHEFRNLFSIFFEEESFENGLLLNFRP